MRIYAVYHGNEGRLVRASTRAQALAHASKTAFNINVATQDELVELITAGVKVETARDASQTELELD